MKSTLRCCHRVFRMKWLGLIVMSAMLFPLMGHATPPPQILDLTSTFDEHIVCWPNNKNFSRNDTARGLTSRGYWWYASGTFSASEHGGTHLDAPSHFASPGIILDEIPVEHLMGSAIVMDANRPVRTIRTIPSRSMTSNSGRLHMGPSSPQIVRFFPEPAVAKSGRIQSNTWEAPLPPIPYPSISQDFFLRPWTVSFTNGTFGEWDSTQPTLTLGNPGIFSRIRC